MPAVATQTLTVRAPRRGLQDITDQVARIVAKGGVATAWMLYEMQARGVMPAALVLNAVNPIMAQGVALADFTMISGFDCDITQASPNGATVEIDPNAERPFIRLV